MIPKLIVTAALMAAQVAIGMTRKTQGPRLDSLKTTTAEYGTAINRFWGKRKFECPIIWAEDLREEKKTSKGKGGKNTQYKYYASFALLICDHEIEAVTRIWMDDKLVYDVTKAGPISVASLLGAGISGAPVSVNGRNMRVYLGTEDQAADPRMEAWCEDRYGADSCPAMRGSAYVVFEDLPVNNFGNRIPNCTIEAVSAKVDAYPYEIVGTMPFGGLINSAITPDGLSLIVTNGGEGADTDTVQVWDLATRSLLTEAAIPLDINSHDFGMVTNTTFYATSDSVIPFTQGSLWLCNTGGGAALLTTNTDGIFVGGAQYKGGTVFALPATNGHFYSFYNGSKLAAVDAEFTVTCFFEDVDGNAWLVGPVGSGGDIGIRQHGGITTIVNTGSDAECGAMDNGHGQFFVFQAGQVCMVDKGTLTLVSTHTTSASASGHEIRRTFNSTQPGADRIWIRFTEHDTETGEELRTENPYDWYAGTTPRTIYDPVNHAIISDGNSGEWRYLDRVASEGVTLKTVVDDVSEWCGLTTQDTLALTQTVLGYSVTQGTGKDMLAPLMDMHDVDCRPHDFGIQFVNRGGAPSGSIATADFVRDGDAARYTVTIQQDTDLPKEVSAKFADVDHDQQINTAIAQRPLDATDSKRTDEIDLSTLADTADGAQQKLERFFRRMWNSRERIKLSLTAQHLALEPGDVTTPSLDGLARNARLDKLIIRGSVLDCEFVRDETSFATLSNSTGAPIEGSDPDVIVIPSPTKGFALDIPLAQDADADINPLIYIAAGGYSGAWPGALAYENDNLIASIDSDAKATWGFATSALATANPNLWDRGNTVDVTVFGTLVSSTEAAINLDPTVNLCAVGADGRWELLNFTTATLTGTSGAGNTYTLSGLKRGRRGTEGNVGNHAAGDSIVLMNMAHIVELGSDAVGDALTFQIQTIGRAPDAATPIDLTFTGATLKPRAPVIAHVTPEDSGDLTITLHSRTRVGGNWNGGPIPTGETIESYAFDVMDGDTVVRTLTSSTKTLTYTAADQATDGFTALQGNAYQLSATVGRGFARAA